MLAFSAVTQFPTNGSSTRAAGESVQANINAEDVMTKKTRRNRIASLELGTARTFLTRFARRCSRQVSDATAPPQRLDAAPDQECVGFPQNFSDARIR